jgi:peptide/nickel transport system substrate-binding protein
VTRHIRWQFLLILLGVVLVGILLTYLAINYTTVLRPGRGGTYIEGIADSPHYLNPLLSGHHEADRDICALVFSSLTRSNEYGELEADLARRWEVTPDNLTYTFYLRSDAYWHDGTPLTADDVIFTIDLVKDPGFPGPPDLGANVWQTVAVKKVDRRTVRFTLSEPFAPFLDYTTIGILPAHLLEGIRAADYDAETVPTLLWGSSLSGPHSIPLLPELPDSPQRLRRGKGGRNSQNTSSRSVARERFPRPQSLLCTSRRVWYRIPQPQTP